MLLRYTSDGMLDTSFNSTGYVLTSMGPDWDEANALDMQPDGKIVLAGFRSGISTTGDNDIALARYLVGDPQPQTVSAALDCQPVSGELPFVSQFTAQLGNLTDENRRVAGRIDVTVAGGGSYGSWRSGWKNLSPGQVFSTAWNQYFPALGFLSGTNTFTLTAEDVTPAPFNQPPYAPSGDTDSDSTTVTASAP